MCFSITYACLSRQISVKLVCLSSVQWQDLDTIGGVAMHPIPGKKTNLGKLASWGWGQQEERGLNSG